MAYFFSALAASALGASLAGASFAGAAFAGAAFGGAAFAACFGAPPDLAGVVILRVARRAALSDGRTITWPPGAPGTAPRMRSRFLSRSTCTTRRFSVVRRWTPMWPDMRRPLNTRPGVWRWPMEPGARCERELPWEA